MSERRPRRTTIRPGLHLLDWLCGYIEAVDDDGTILAHADRFTLSSGATFSGWVVRTDFTGNYTDQIANKPRAIKQLIDMAKEVQK